MWPRESTFLSHSLKAVLCLEQWFSAGSKFFPIWQHQETFLVVIVPASNGWKPGTLLNILGCIGQTLISKNYPAQNVNSAEVGLEGTGPCVSSIPGCESNISLPK